MIVMYGGEEIIPPLAERTETVGRDAMLELLETFDYRLARPRNPHPQIRLLPNQLHSSNLSLLHNNSQYDYVTSLTHLLA